MKRGIKSWAVIPLAALLLCGTQGHSAATGRGAVFSVALLSGEDIFEQITGAIDAIRKSQTIPDEARNPLIAKLGATIQTLSQLQFDAATNEIDAFLKQVSDNQKLSADDRTDLTNRGNTIKQSIANFSQNKSSTNFILGAIAAIFDREFWVRSAATPENIARHGLVSVEKKTTVEEVNYKRDKMDKTAFCGRQEFNVEVFLGKVPEQGNKGIPAVVRQNLQVKTQNGIFGSIAVAVSPVKFTANEAKAEKKPERVFEVCQLIEESSIELFDGQTLLEKRVLKPKPMVDFPRQPLTQFVSEDFVKTYNTGVYHDAPLTRVEAGLPIPANPEVTPKKNNRLVIKDKFLIVIKGDCNNDQKFQKEEIVAVIRWEVETEYSVGEKETDTTGQVTKLEVTQFKTAKDLMPTRRMSRRRSMKRRKTANSQTRTWSNHR